MSKQARIRTQEMRKAQEEAVRRQRTRQRIIAVVGAAVVVGLIVAIVVVAVRAANSEDKNGTPAANGDVTAPASATDDGAIPVGEDAAPVTVDIYYDYMCPACGAFEKANGEELARLVEAGDIQVMLRPISFLDQQSQGTEYSTRTANAIATVADGAPEAVWDFHAALYEAQPEEGSEGLSDDEIADLATEAGVPEKVVDQFEARSFEDWVKSVTDAAFAAGIEGTPTVKINGELYAGDLYTPGALTQAIEAAG